MDTKMRRRASTAGLSFGVARSRSAGPARRIMTIATATALAVGATGTVAAQAATASSADRVAVIVRELPGSGDAAERAVSAVGGTVERPLHIINGFTASVPADRLIALRSTPGVFKVSEDAGLTLADADVSGQVAQAGSLYTLANQVTGAADMWNAGATGKGVDVALIDSGVVPVEGLTAPGKVVNGPDLTPETGTQAKNLDTFGHGTAMAGIIAGRDSAAAAPYAGNASDFVGMAPDARIVSIKVADAQGQTDVSQAIAAIDWVVSNGRKNGLNVRVLNLSFGTDGVQSYRLDPLAYAAEQAWHAGVVVVVSAGNQGNTTGRLDNPAFDPYLLAVGSDNANGTATTADDVVSSFSNGGDGVRNPDIVAPGDHVVSLRDPGSYLDAQYPAARIGDRLFRGSGTSQAAAVVSGAAALLLSERPSLTPDQVKALLTSTAQALPGAAATLQGHGLIDLAAARTAPTPTDATQNWPRSTGLGSLEAARGSIHVVANGKQVTGEFDVNGRAFDAARVADGIRNRTNWSGARWGGTDWSSLRWGSLRWGGVDYSSLRWGGVDYSSLRWGGVDYSSLRWGSLRWGS
ncbi:MAG: peptidase and in kexin sedolisin, partial [Blastococcus sp.]|nr:peptidase and in kexin sedolisin [Blastococcus sp.]